MAGLEELVFAGETCVLSELGIEGRARFRYSGGHSGGVGNCLSRFSDLCLGDDDITVSTQGDSFGTPAPSLLSRREMPVSTKIAFLFRSLCLRRVEVAKDVCLVPSSHSGAGAGD